MAAAQFSDDAYNKRIEGPAAGTLVGNWFEERVLRETTGEGRTTAQRHIPRSGLLRDFTKVCLAPRKFDNTFERVYGPKAAVHHNPSSLTIGGFSQAFVQKVGPKEVARGAAKEKLIADQVRREDAEYLEVYNERRFDTTTGAHFEKPDEALAERAEHLKDSCKNELMHGPAPDRTLAMNNLGLEAPTHAHYSNVETITHARMSLGDPVLRSDVRVSAATGVVAFGRSSEFTKPILEFTRGTAKDEELEVLFQSLGGTKPMRHIGGGQPQAKPFAAVPSLAALKSAIHMRISEVWGPCGYVALRQRLFDCGDHEGFVEMKAVVEIVRDQLGLSAEEVSEKDLEAYLKGLVTMKRTALRAGTLLTSLRPAPGQQERRRMIEAFRALDPVDGSVRLGAWLARVTDAELRGVVAGAFGAREQDDEAAVADSAVSESVFVELLSDLAAFMHIHALLA